MNIRAMATPFPGDIDNMYQPQLEEQQISSAFVGRLQDLLGVRQATVSSDKTGHPAKDEDVSTHCAKENETCEFEGKKIVFYGHDSFFAAVKEDGTECDNSTFGDPQPGQRKSCYIMDTDEVTQCATQGGKCGFSGTYWVIYGNIDNTGQLKVEQHTDGVECTNDTFGGSGTGNKCYIIGAAPGSGNESDDDDNGNDSDEEESDDDDDDNGNGERLNDAFKGVIDAIGAQNIAWAGLLIAIILASR